MTEAFPTLLIVAAHVPHYAKCYQILVDGSILTESELRKVLAPHVTAMHLLHERTPKLQPSEVAYAFYTLWCERTSDETILGTVCAAAHIYLEEA